MKSLNRAALEAITPGAEVLYRQTFENFEQQLQPYAILESARRAEHFLAQVLHETGGLRLLVENLNYSAARLMAVWPTRFPTLESAEPFAHNSRALANKVYGGRMGNDGPNDGWRFIGRGLLQLTGREHYARVGQALGLDLERLPTLVLDPEFGLRIAGEIWIDANCNAAADQDDLEKVTRGINGGTVGISERRVWLTKVRANRVIN